MRITLRGIILRYSRWWYWPLPNFLIFRYVGVINTQNNTVKYLGPILNIFGDIAHSRLSQDTGFFQKLKILDFQIQILGISIKYPWKCLFILRICIIVTQKMQLHWWVLIAEKKYGTKKGNFFDFVPSFCLIFWNQQHAPKINFSSE